VMIWDGVLRLITMEVAWVGDAWSVASFHNGGGVGRRCVLSPLEEGAWSASLEMDVA